MIIAVPADTPVSTPDELPIVATDSVPLVHVPPVIVSVNVIDIPTHIDGVPAINDGGGLTVTTMVVLSVVPAQSVVRILKESVPEYPKVGM